MARAIWKGSISFGLVHIPVGLFPAEEREELSFRQLDKRNMSPIGYKKYNKATGKDVQADDIVRGYEYEPGHYVVVSDEDFKRANPEATQTVEITDFVDAGEITAAYFDKPYYLAPLNKRAAKSYALLRETLRRTGKIGVSNVVIRSRQHLAAVIPVGDVLVLELLRYPAELRKPAGLDLPGSIKESGVTPKELEMAEKLVEGMTSEWDPSRYHDTYREDLMSLIERKARAGDVEEAAAVFEEDEDTPRRGDVIDIMTLLKRSVEEAGKGGRAKPAASKSTAKASTAKAESSTSRTAGKPKRPKSAEPAKPARKPRKSA